MSNSNPQRKKSANQRPLSDDIDQGADKFLDDDEPELKTSVGLIPNEEKTGLKKSGSMSSGVSVPTELEDQVDQEEYLKEAEEVHKRTQEEKKLEKAKERYRKKHSRNLTQVLGTKRYNPFMFGGSVSSMISSFGSNFETKRKKDLRKALYVDDPIKLHIVGGWYNLLREGDELDENDNVTSSKGKPRKRANSKGKSTLTPGQIRALNTVARKSNLDPLSPDEIAMIEDRMDKEKPNKAGCFSFIKSCWNTIIDGRKKKLNDEDYEDEHGRTPSGKTDLDQSLPPEVDDLAITPALKVRKNRNVQKHKKNKVKSSNVKSKANQYAGNCLISGRRVLFKDLLVEGNENGDIIHKDNVRCDLCRVILPKEFALETRERGLALICDKCKVQVSQTKEAQRELHSTNPKSKPNEYLALVPNGYKMFLPVTIRGMNKIDGRGYIPMCSESGVQIRRSDKKVKTEGAELMLNSYPKNDKLIKRLRVDLKVAAVGLEDSMRLNIRGTNGLLNDPFEQTFLFKRDEASLQYDLRQGVKNSFTVVYNIAGRLENELVFKLDRMKAETLYFDGELMTDMGPFLAGHKVLRQEQDMRTTGNSVVIRGRYEHGVLYDWSLKMHLNAKDNTLTPLSLEIILRVRKL